MARSVAGEAAWQRQAALRQYALEPLKAALAGRTQAGLVEQINKRTRLDVTPRMFSFYLSGYSRMPRTVLAEACKIVGIGEWDVLQRVQHDETVLLQPKAARKSAKKRTTASC